MVQSVTITMDDFSPAIQYNGAWRDGSPGDPYYQSYYNNGTHTTTTAIGANATFTFTGTGVWIYGAKRDNHGIYNISLDGQLYQDDGYYAYPGTFQQLLFSAEGLNPTQPHTVAIIDAYTNASRSYVDIDFITYQIEMPDGYEDVKQQDTASNFVYSPSGWTTSPVGLDQYDGGTGHSTNLRGAFMEYTFEGFLVVDARIAAGSHVEIYGVVGPSCGYFEAQLDGGSAMTLNAYRSLFNTQMVLYQASGLGPGNHTVKITNDITAGQTLGIDYAIVGRPPPSTTFATGADSNASRTSSLSAGGGAGIAIGVFIFLILVAASAFWWYRRRSGKQLEFPPVIQSGLFPYYRGGSVIYPTSPLAPLIGDSTLRNPAISPLEPISLLPATYDFPGRNGPSLYWTSPRMESGASSTAGLLAQNGDVIVGDSRSLTYTLSERSRGTAGTRETRDQVESRVQGLGTITSPIVSGSGLAHPDDPQ